MKHQLQTIQTGLAIAIDAEGFVDKPVRRALLAALTALSELERMAGEPVADKATPGLWFVRKRERDGVLIDCFVSAPDCQGFAYDAEILGDDEYRDDVNRKLADCELIVAAVNAYRAAPPAQQPQSVDWEKLYRLEVKKKGALAAKYERDTGRKLTRIVPMAQQPQAEPKCECNATTGTFCEACTEYRNWKQPQAEPFGYVSQHTNGSWEFSPTAAGVYRDTAKSITAVYTKQPQADAVHRYVLELPDGDKREVKVYWVDRQETAEEITHRLCIAVDAEPQQAEAVPSDVVRDAARYRWLRSTENASHEAWNHFGPYSSPLEIDAAIDAAMAQGEKP